MLKPRVLLISSQQLFSESLEVVLRAETEIELIGTWELNEKEIDKRLSQAQPSVVIIADENLQSAEAEKITQTIMESHPSITVIRAGLNDKVFRVFSSKTLPAYSANLLETIRNCINPAQESNKTNPSEIL